MIRAYKGHRPKRNPEGHEQANPKNRADRITPSDVWRTKLQSGPVKTWADMTPEQQKRVLAQLNPSGTR